jgi:hypothetical protein
VIDRAVGLGLGKAGDAFEKAGVFSGQGIGFALMGMVLLLATVAMGGIGGAFILMAKATLAILAALGPLFIAALLFERTKHFFQNWLSMVATYGLVVVIIGAVFTFLLAIFGNYMSGVSFDGVLNVAYAVGGSAILALVSILILLEVKTVAVGLGGGYAHEMGRGLLLYFMTLRFLNRRMPSAPPPPQRQGGNGPPAGGSARTPSPPPGPAPRLVGPRGNPARAAPSSSGGQARGGDGTRGCSAAPPRTEGNGRTRERATGGERSRATATTQGAPVTTPVGKGSRSAGGGEDRTAAFGAAGAGATQAGGQR